MYIVMLYVLVELVTGLIFVVVTTDKNRFEIRIVKGALLGLR